MLYQLIESECGTEICFCGNLCVTIYEILMNLYMKIIKRMHFNTLRGIINL